MSDGDRREPPIGRYLAGQRRLRGFSLDDLASLTKIPRRSLERLEAGAFDHSTDGFARGFVRTVAAALGLDPDETVNRLLAEPLDADDDPSRRRAQLLRWGVVAGAAVVLVALGLGLRAWLVGGEPRAEPAAPNLVYRRDAVRALADEAGSVPMEAEAEPLPSERGERED